MINKLYIMIIDKIIKMTWNSNNKKYYEEKGYVYTKMYDEFTLKIEDLIHKSQLKVNVKCDVCGIEKLIKYELYNLSINNGGYYSCSQKCSVSKSKNTCLENYGVERFIQSDIGKEKIKNTNIIRYGKEYASQCDKIKEKVRSTCMERFGTDYVFKNDEVKKKIKKTFLEKYGFECAAKSEVVKNKYKETCSKKYGVDNLFKSDIIKERIKDTCFVKYGFTHHTKNKDIMDKITQTQIEKYGEIWKEMVPKYNRESIVYLDLISDIIKIPIQHALNGGEKKFAKYWIDGYIEKYNICIEWDERGHNYKKEYDASREEFIKQYNNCLFLRINQDEFLEDIDSSILDVVSKINLLIESIESNF